MDAECGGSRSAGSDSPGASGRGRRGGGEVGAGGRAGTDSGPGEIEEGASLELGEDLAIRTIVLPGGMGSGSGVRLEVEHAAIAAR